MKILFTGGGTLGPITPLLAIASELKNASPEAEMLFVGTPNGPERHLVKKAGFRFLVLDAPKLHRHFTFRNLSIPFRLISSLFRALRIIRDESPDVIVGAGGYTSVPMGLVAKICGKKLLIHQQDVVPSLSNRILARFADAITVTFEKSLDDFPKDITVLTGNPVRPIFEKGDKKRGLEILGFTGKRPIVLVTGGGTGSAFLNEIVRRASPAWTSFVDVVHITGIEKFSSPAPDLPHGERYRRMNFAGDEIAHLFAVADIVVTRAGLGTMTELATLGKPVVIVPMPDSHQERNASFVIGYGGGRLLKESDLTPERLIATVRELLSNPEEMRDMGERLRCIFVPGAREAVAGRVMELIARTARKHL